jgi:hypothetical protein
MSGIALALNYPTEFDLIRYDPFGKTRTPIDGKGVYHVRYLENIQPGGFSFGWRQLALDEAFVRSCMTTLGPKAWIAPTKYEEVFI